MIKNFKQFNEGINHLLVGPTDDDIIEYWKSIGITSPDDLLEKSVEDGVLKGVKIAIENGANIHYGNDLLLVMASQKGHYNIVEYGLSLGLNKNINYALKYACQYNHINVVELLLDNGADIHIDNEYCLKISVEYYYFEMFVFLLKRGADIHATNDWCIRKVNSGKTGYTKFKNLINKLNLTNEGINHLLVGPTKEEMWSNLGFSKPFDTLKEYLNYIVERIEKNDIGYKFIFKYKNSDIFQYFIGTSILYVNDKMINIIENIFNIDLVDVLNLIKLEVVPKLNLPQTPKKIEKYRII